MAVSVLLPWKQERTIWLQRCSRKFYCCMRGAAWTVRMRSRIAFMAWMPSTKSSSKTLRMTSGSVTLQMRQLRKQLTKRLRKSPSPSSIRPQSSGASSRRAWRMRVSSLKKRGEPSWQRSRKALRRRKWWRSWEYLGRSTRGKATTMPRQTYSRPLQQRTCWSSIAYRISESYTHCMISFSCSHTRSASALLPRRSPIARTTLCSFSTFCFRLRSSSSASSQERIVRIYCLLCQSHFYFAANYCSIPSAQLAICHKSYLPFWSLLLRERTALRSLRLSLALPSTPFSAPSAPATSRCFRCTNSCHSSRENSLAESLRSRTMKVSSSTTMPTVMSSSCCFSSGGTVIQPLRERKTSSLGGEGSGSGCSSSNSSSSGAELFMTDILIFQIQSIKAGSRQALETAQPRFMNGERRHLY